MTTLLINPPDDLAVMRARGNLRPHPAYLWPKDKPFVTYTPSAPAVVPRWQALLVDVSIAVVLGLIGWGLYELLGRQ